MKRGLALLLVISLFASSLHAKVALVLSGGGARGLAHIAIIEAVEEAGIPIDLVVGTSMGALIGGLYSAGYTTEEIRSLVESTDMLGLFAQSPLVASRNKGRAFASSYEHTFSLGFTRGSIGDAPALLGDQRIMELLGFLFAKYPNTIDFDELPIPFRAVSTDVVSTEAVIHDHGSLVRAIRSSIAIPMIFSPFPSDDGKLLLDGGLVDNLPIEVARNLGADYVIASDVNAEVVDDLAQLESLSVIAMQTVILATRVKAITQWDQADLLYKIPLKEFNALDFNRFEEIIERGERVAEEQRDELLSLAREIEESRTEPYTEPMRSGYQDLVAPLILSVEVMDLSVVAHRRPLEATSFSRFVGKRLDEKTARELNLLLRELRVAKGISMLSYEMGEDGVLTILMRGYNKGNGQVNMGFTADMGFSNNLVSTSSWFRADAFLDARIKEVFTTPLTLSVSAQLGTKSLMQLGVSYPFSFPQWGSIDVNLSLGYSVGSLTPLSSSIKGDRSPPLDRLLSPMLDMALTFADGVWLHFSGYYNLAFLHNTTYEPTFLPHGGFILSLLYNTLENRFSSQGIRIDTLAAVGFSTQLDWMVRLSLQHKIAISVDDSIRYDAAISLMRMPYQLLDSYADLGSFDGIPGYSPLSLARDSALVGLQWQHRLWELLGYPTYAKVTVRGGLFDRYDPYSGTAPSVDSLFFEPDWDLGFGLSAGLDAPIGEVVVCFGASVKGRIAFMVGIH